MHKRFGLICLAVALVGVATWWTGREDNEGADHVDTELGGKTMTGDRIHRVVATAEPASEDATTKPVTALAESTRRPRERMLESAELAAEVLLLRKKWERDTVEVLRSATEEALKGGKSALVLHLPAFGSDADAALEALVGRHAVGFDVELDGQLLGKVQKRLGWPKTSRVLIGMANEDGSDSLVLMNGAGPESIEISPDTGELNISASELIALTDKIERSGYDHLLSVQEEGE